MIPSTVRSTRATSTVKPQDTAPPDNLVDWWRWVTKPAAPGPVARNRGQPLEVSSTPGIARAAPAPAQKPRPAEPKAPEAVTEVAARREVETPMRVGASPSHLESDGKRQAKLSDEKAKSSRKGDQERCAGADQILGLAPAPAGRNLQGAGGSRVQSDTGSARAAAPAGLHAQAEHGIGPHPDHPTRGAGPLDGPASTRSRVPAGLRAELSL